MVLYLDNESSVIWRIDDDSIKNDPQFKDDDNCIVIADDIEIPVAPEDNKIRALKYSRNTGILYYEVTGIIEVPHEEVTRQMYLAVEATSSDTLTNMELGTDTNTKVTTTGSDSLLLMEMLVTIDEKLTQLLSQKA